MNASTQNPAAVPTGKFVEVAIALVFNDQDQLLICRRKKDAVLGGFWEFPGGKCNPGEEPQACARREVLEETALTVTVSRSLDLIEHEYPHAKVRLHPFVCRLSAGTLQLLEVAEAKWIDPSTLLNYQFPAANTSLIKRAAEGLSALMEFPSPH